MSLTANFSETAQTNLSASVPESGGSWIDCGSTAPSPQIFSILGGILGPGGNGLGLYRYSGIAASADTVVSAIFNYQSPSFSSVGILARMNAAGTAGYLAAYIPGSSQWGIFRIQPNGTTTTLAFSAAIAYAANDTPSIDFDVAGSGASVALVLKIGGVAVVTTTDATASRVITAGYPGVWFSATSGAGTGMFIERMSSIDAVVTNSVILTTLTGKIYPLSGGTTGTAALAVAGTYTGTPPNQWRLVPDGGSASVAGFDWQAFSNAPSAGSFAQTAAAVPKTAGWYNMQVRDSAVPATVYTTGKLGAGAFIVVDGQSNAWLWFSSDARGGDGSLTPSPLLRVTGKQATNAWAVPSATMNAAISCGNALVAAIGCPIGIIDGSWDASGLTIAGANGGSGPNGQWVPTSTNAYGSSLNAITAAGGKVIGNLWIQGEGDAGVGVSQAAYYNALGTMIAQRRADLGAAGLPYIMVTLASNTVGMSDTAREAIKLAQLQKCADVNVYRVDRLDLPLSDGVHHNPAGFTALGKRCAQAVLAAVGLAAQYRGPSIASVAEVSATVFDVMLTHHMGSDFTPTSAITGFRVTDPGAGDAVIAVSSAVRQSATSIRLTLASDPIAPPKMAYLWGSAPVVTGVTLDNSVLTLPLEYSAGVVAGAVTVTYATTVTFSVVDAAGAPVTGQAGLDYAFYDQPRISNALAPVKNGTTFAISGGSATIDITGVTSLLPGQTGRIEWGDAAGTKRGGGQVVVS